MEELIKLVRTYRLTAGLAERDRLAEAIFSVVEPRLSLFVFKAIRPAAADDVLQEVLKAVIIGLPKFSGATGEKFLAWCYTIARNKINDQYRAQANDRLQPLPPEELWELADASAQDAPLAAGERLDLDYAMKLLSESKPECVENLQKFFILGLDYGEIAEEQNVNYDAARMTVRRCLETVRELVA